MNLQSAYTDEELMQIQKCELEILKKFAEICDKYNLVYFLDSGTALGAVRHKGFIPWDDDIDVGMPRADYDKFMEIAPAELGDEYFLQNVFTDEGCPFIFSKVRKNKTAFVEWNKASLKMNHGIYIDIFPYDVLPKENRKEFMDNCTNMTNKFFRRYIPGRARPDNVNLKWYVGNAVKMMFYVAGKFTNKLAFARKIEDYAIQYNCEKDENSSYFCPYFLGDQIFDGDMLFPCEKLQFEDAVFSVPRDYDGYLKVLYGDYMQLPPVEQRYGHRPLLIDLENDYDGAK